MMLLNILILLRIHYVIKFFPEIYNNNVIPSLYYLYILILSYNSAEPGFKAKTSSLLGISNAISVKPVPSMEMNGSIPV